MANLFDLTADYLQILDMMDDPELDQQTLADTMEGIEGALEDKFDNYVYVYKQEQGDVDVLGETIKQLQARKKSKEENLKKLKKVMTDVMNVTGKISLRQHNTATGYRRTRKVWLLIQKMFVIFQKTI